jgi:hypothetical protein
MDKNNLLKAAWIRAYRSFLQAIVAQIPAGFVITPAMIQYFKIGYIYVIIAILCNAAIYSFTSFVTCMVGGLPEVNLADTLYALDNEPHNEEEDVEDDEDGDE